VKRLYEISVNNQSTHKVINCVFEYMKKDPLRYFDEVTLQVKSSIFSNPILT
jgi:hypothetical protein